MVDPVADTSDTVDPSLDAVVGPQTPGAAETPASPQAETPSATDSDGPADAGESSADIGEAVSPPPVGEEAQLDASESAPRDSTPSLPGYTQSLLRISVPVMVTLAEKRQPLSQVLELSPGAIIQFDKSCEEMLDLSVAGLKVAAGEAVKVGDKFGLKITSVVLPEERFDTVRPKPKS